MAEGSGKQGVAKRTRAKRGKGSGCVCLQRLEGLQQRRLIPTRAGRVGRGASGLSEISKGHKESK